MTNKTINLSVQQLVDCSSTSGNYGCSGGSLKNTLRYLERQGGLMKEESYPYIAQESSCKYQHKLKFVNVTSWGILTARDARKLEKALVEIGPIAVSINASPKTFQLYDHGIYDDQACSSDQVNHAMLLVGFTEEYWILKNWWTDKWGENGYMRVAKKNNLCGITNYAAFARISIISPNF
ncbi:cathepsin K [Aphidius gifuensis]|nr:cathepsin K [Aphidius gifuensis]